jgi:peptidoglycan hydrolase-like protein with peptidoglycan-binding domain
VSTIDDTHAVPSITDSEAEMNELRRRRRGLIWLALGVVLVAAVAIGTWLWASGDSTESSAAETGPVATAEVTRTTLTATETWEGTLGHGAPFTVAAQGPGSSSQSESEPSSPSLTVTRLAEQGATVGRGDELYRVNERPVTLLLGAIPMYRDLAPGASGPDIKQLEANLAKLGYRGFTADNEYTSSTAAAIRDWQDDIGAEVTGVVSQASVVFMPERGLVDSLHVGVGDAVHAAAPGTPILDITGTDQVVSVEVEVDDRDLVDVDTEVTVTLPDGSEVAGTVTALTVVEAEPAPGGAEGAAPAETDPVAEVEVTLAKAAPREFIGAPVDVIVGVDERTDVLAVPVNALLALAEGGYGLEVVGDDGRTEIVAVDTGLFADGRVEVRGGGITEGTVVGVAGR